jgi:hypothetical protein
MEGDELEAGEHRPKLGVGDRGGGQLSQLVAHATGESREAENREPQRGRESGLRLGKT